MISVVGISHYTAACSTIYDVLHVYENGLVRMPTSSDSHTEPNMAVSARRAESGLQDVLSFDARFFRVLPTDARFMDPQQRKLVEHCHDCLMDAGLDLDTAREAMTIGCFIGAGIANYLEAAAVSPASGFAEATRRFIGNDVGCLALKAAYLLELTGPAMTVGSTCSSGLAAAHVAMNAIASGECDLAIAAGCSIDLLLSRMASEPGGIISGQGRCLPLSDLADGTVFSNGICVALLASEQAVERLDLQPYCEIVASGMNNDGRRKAGFTAPSQRGQTELIRRVTIKAGLTKPPSLVELHGTGTRVGDPIEVAALAEAYSDFNVGTAFVSSGKSNFGHLNAGAGALGLLRLVTSLDAHRCFQSVGCEPLNTQINWAGGPLQPAKKSTMLSDEQPIGAVTSLGVGGTNVHMVLRRSPPKMRQQQTYVDTDIPLLIGSHREELLDCQCDAVLAVADLARDRIDDLARTCRRLFGQAPFKRLYIIDRPSKRWHWNADADDLLVSVATGIGTQVYTLVEWRDDEAGDVIGLRTNHPGCAYERTVHRRGERHHADLTFGDMLAIASGAIPATGGTSTLIRGIRKAFDKTVYSLA